MLFDWDEQGFKNFLSDVRSARFPVPALHYSLAGRKDVGTNRCYFLAVDAVFYSITMNSVLRLSGKTGLELFEAISCGAGGRLTSALAPV